MVVALNELKQLRRVQHPPGIQDPELPYMHTAKRYFLDGGEMETAVTVLVEEEDGGTRMRSGAWMEVSTLLSFGSDDGSEFSLSA